MIDLRKDINEKKYEEALEALQTLNICGTSYDDFQQEATGLFDTFVACHELTDDRPNQIAIKCLNLLKRSCARGETFQNAIIAREGFVERMHDVLVAGDGKGVRENVQMNCLQLLANLSVQNKANQERILEKLGTFLLANVADNNVHANASAMILYNGFIYKAGPITLVELLDALLSNVELNRQRQQQLPEFVSIFLEYLISESNEIEASLGEMAFEKRTLLLRYLIEYVREEDCRSRPIHPDLFKHLLAEFKKKSDAVLQTENSSKLDDHASEEMFTLLILLTDATCVDPYASFLRHDGALFLNLGCLLRQMQLVGSMDAGSIFAPVQKIEEILKVRQGTSELNIEQDISYSLKSAIVKALANLAYKTKKNQTLARDMDIMTAILECTNLDARNPLIKEWSILAIRNLCDDNLENQKFIAGLKKLGDAENSLLTEYGAGTIRIRDAMTTNGSRGQ